MSAYARGARRRFRTGLAAVIGGMLCAMFVLLPAGAANASTSDSLSLSLTGGGRVSAHAGDSVTFTATGDLTQVSADFSALPGGDSTVLHNGVSRTFHFVVAGTYTVSWTAQNVVSTTSILGKLVTTVTNLAHCSASVVVAPLTPVVSKATSAIAKVEPPAVHISVSVPKVPVGHRPASGAAPAAPHSSTTTMAPAGQSAQAAGAAAVSSTSSTSSAGAAAAPGGASSTAADGAGSGGYAHDLATSGDKQLAQGNPLTTGSPARKGSSTTAAAADRAATPQLPIYLAIAAIVVLTLVGASYTRLVLFRRMS